MLNETNDPGQDDGSGLSAVASYLFKLPSFNEIQYSTFRMTVKNRALHGTITARSRHGTARHGTARWCSKVSLSHTSLL
jgi:hypothetical protein